MVRIQPPQPSLCSNPEYLLRQLHISVENAPAGVDSDSIAKAINSVGQLIAVEGQEITIRFVGPAHIANLHAEFKGKPGPTNILTFGTPSGGDIAICPKIAAEDAAIRGWDLRCELIYLAVHGTLHALGFHHAESDSTHRMRNLERQALDLLNIDPAPLGLDGK